MSMTKGELVKIIIAGEDELADNVDAFGFDWTQAAAKLEEAKRELATRYHQGVGYGGILYTMPTDHDGRIVYTSETTR